MYSADGLKQIVIFLKKPIKIFHVELNIQFRKIKLSDNILKY